MTLNLLSKLKYPLLTLPTTGAGVGICSTLCHPSKEKELEEIQEKDKEIKVLEEKYKASEEKRAEQRKKFIDESKQGDAKRKDVVAAVYLTINDYANCVRETAKEMEEINRKALLSTYYLTQKELDDKCKEPAQR